MFTTFYSPYSYFISYWFDHNSNPPPFLGSRLLNTYQLLIIYLVRVRVTNLYCPGQQDYVNTTPPPHSKTHNCALRVDTFTLGVDLFCRRIQTIRGQERMVFTHQDISSHQKPQSEKLEDWWILFIVYPSLWFIHSLSGAPTVLIFKNSKSSNVFEPCNLSWINSEKLNECFITPHMK